MSAPTYADHLRAATAALIEADDRLSAARLAIGRADRPPELEVAGKLVTEARSLTNTVRRQAVAGEDVDPLEQAEELREDVEAEERRRRMAELEERTP